MDDKPSCTPILGLGTVLKWDALLLEPSHFAISFRLKGSFLRSQEIVKNLEGKHFLKWYHWCLEVYFLKWEHNPAFDICISWFDYWSFSQLQQMSSTPHYLFISSFKLINLTFYQKDLSTLFTIHLTKDHHVLELVLGIHKNFCHVQPIISSRI